jgi:plasmid stabilization system protein ParE
MPNEGNYRIIYRAAEHRVEILTVYHSARLLDELDD